MSVAVDSCRLKLLDVQVEPAWFGHYSQVRCGWVLMHIGMDGHGHFSVKIQKHLGDTYTLLTELQLTSSCSVKCQRVLENSVSDTWITRIIR